jgi:hypothetical protein
MILVSLFSILAIVCSVFGGVLQGSKRYEYQDLHVSCWAEPGNDKGKWDMALDLWVNEKLAEMNESRKSCETTDRATPQEIIDTRLRSNREYGISFVVVAVYSWILSIVVLIVLVRWTRQIRGLESPEVGS